MFDPRRASQGDEREPSFLPSCKTPWLAGWLSHRKSSRFGPARKRDATSDAGCYSACSPIPNSVSFHHEFLSLCVPFSSLAPSHRPLRVSASLVPRLLSERLGSHDKGASLLADAQTLLVPGNPPTQRKQFRANGNVQYCMLEARGRC